jgi:hypothetical protein
MMSRTFVASFQSSATTAVAHVTRNAIVTPTTLLCLVIMARRSPLG